ncbi:hypothetical protein [Rufibacter psychrotolerans]|uniref:hypothetical protein n=1 Tax=Rufibacter psychrotolerans TaxID=2812556 RepID=UPI0019689079|nr:hypothetical protein [Rufibacter sp. SYSU D00308]
MVIGPFEIKNNIGLLALTESSIFVITLDFWTSLKYNISLQIPFIFDNTIDELKNKPINYLLEKFKSERIDYLDGLQADIVKSKLWKNQIIVQHRGITTKLGILDRGRTDDYGNIISAKVENYSKV